MTEIPKSEALAASNQERLQALVSQYQTQINPTDFLYIRLELLIDRTYGTNDTAPFLREDFEVAFQERVAELLDKVEPEARRRRLLAP